MSLTKRTPTTLATGLLLCTLASSHAVALEGSWQAGVNAGISLLSPDTDGSGFTLDNDQSTAFSVYLGYDLTPIISAEIAFSDLGEAELSQNETIGYQAVSFGATAYIFGEAQAVDRGEGLSAYVRLGLSVIDNESGIALNESNNTAVWMGAGIQYPFSPSWGLRAELASYDGDAQAVMAGVYFRTGGRRSRQSVTGALATPSINAERAQSSTDNSVPAQPVTTPVPAPEAPAQPEARPIAQPKVAQTATNCPPQAAAVIANSSDCSLLNSAVADLEFEGNTATIVSQSAQSLDRVAAALKRYPNLVIEVRVHTQSLGNAQTEAQLSAQRARSVALYLVQNGVPVSQLRAKAFGATQPISDDNTAAGRQQNNRVVLRSL